MLTYALQVREDSKWVDIALELLDMLTYAHVCSRMLPYADVC
jgi:hypothetical protein